MIYVGFKITSLCLHKKRPKHIRREIQPLSPLNLQLIASPFRYRSESSSNMGSLRNTPEWEELAAGKRQAVLDLIPLKWRLPLPLPSSKTQKNVTGTYLHKYLTTREIEITETDAVHIVEQTSVGIWTATEVVTAFCHRAALAHQLVRVELDPVLSPFPPSID